MNFRNACEQMLHGQAVRRTSWHNTLYRVKFGPAGNFLATDTREDLRFVLTLADTEATDWEIYKDTDYQLIHDFSWAIQQMAAGHDCTNNGVTHYYREGPMVMVRHTERQDECCYLNIDHFIKAKWARI